MKRYPETGSLWRALLSKLKYWVVVPPFMGHDCWSFNKISVQVKKFFSKTNLFQDGNKKTMVKRIINFFNIHCYKKTFHIRQTADFSYVRN